MPRSGMPFPELRCTAMPPQHGDLWPLPSQSGFRRGAVRAWATLFNVAAVITAGLLEDTGPVASVDGKKQDAATRLANMRAGKAEHVSVQIFGEPCWGHRYGPDTFLNLTIDRVEHSGSGRAVPVHQFMPVAIYKPRGKRGLKGVRRRSWIIDVDGPAGPGTIAGRLEDLALVAAVGGWPVPPELPALVGRR